MYAKVKLLNGFKEPLLYKIPEQWDTKPGVNSLVKVPLQKRFEYALIEEILPTLDPSITFTIKPIAHHEQVDVKYCTFIEKIARYYGIATRILYQRLQTYLEKPSLQLAEIKEQDIKNIYELTTEQEHAVAAVLPFIQQPSFAPFLFWFDWGQL